MQRLSATSWRSSTGGKRLFTPVPDVGPDGTALSHALMQSWDTRRQTDATPLAVRVATRPRHGPVPAPVRLPPEPGPHGAPAGSGG